MLSSAHMNMVSCCEYGNMMLCVDGKVRMNVWIRESYSIQVNGFKVSHICVGMG